MGLRRLTSRIGVTWLLLAVTAAAAVAPRPIAPVVVAGRTLFKVSAVPGGPSADERAAVLAARIRSLAAHTPGQIHALHTVAGHSATLIVGPAGPIATVTDTDAHALGMARTLLATRERDAIVRAALSIQAQQRWHVNLIGALYAVLATLALLLVLRLLALAFTAWLYPRLESWRGRYIRSIRIQGFELVPAERLTALLFGVARALRAVLSLLALYLYVAAVLVSFPATRGYVGQIVGYALAPLRASGEALAHFLPSLFYLILIGVAAFYFSRFMRLVFGEIRRGSIKLRGFYPEWALPTYKIVRFLIVIFALIAAFPYIPGSKSPAFRALSLFFGLLLSLGSSSAIANVVAGVVLTYTRAFRIGDRVSVGSTTGDVVESTLLVTRVRTVKNVEVAIPNAMVLGSHIVNFSAAAQRHGLIVHTSVTIGYDAPWRKIHELLIEAAVATEHVLADPAPFVLQTALSDFYVSYEINAYTHQPRRMVDILSALHQNIQDRFSAAGVEIMSPHMYGVRDANRAAIPPGRAAPAPEPPGFRIAGLWPRAPGEPPP